MREHGVPGSAVYARKVLWPGVIHSSLAALAFLLLLASAPFAPRGMIQLRNRLLAARANQCPFCRYDLAGVLADAPCPECGRARKA